MEKVLVKTRKKREVIDITVRINEIIKERKLTGGICFLNLLHTTAAISTADMDPGADLDMMDAFDELIPKLKYRHPHNPAHMPDHILSTLIGTSLVLTFDDKGLVLGTWQRVVLFEFDGPREREITVYLLKGD